MPVDINKIAELYERSLTGELDIARATFQHNGQKGSSLERAVQSILERFLPEKVGVTEGIVIDSEGFVSNQLDIILYDKLRAQLFYKSDSTNVIPAEFVFAIGEVKAVLNKAAYDQAFDSQLKVKSSKRYLMKPLNGGHTYHGYGTDREVPPIASFIVAFEGNKDSLHQWAVESHINNPIDNCIDAILVPSVFLTARASEGLGPDLQQGKMSRLETVSEHTLFRFLGLLAKAACEWHMRESPEIYRYFMSVGGIPNSLITSLDPEFVSHN